MTPIFAPNEVILTPRLRLSALDITTLDTLGAWVSAAASPDWTFDDVRAAVEGGAGVLIADLEGTPIGLAVVALDTPMSGCASVPLIAIDPLRRFRGLGGEAGLALEQHLRERLGVSTVYAPVPDGRGLAVYFWLRLGYRPLVTSAAPGPVVGLTGESRAGIWMVRERE